MKFAKDGLPTIITFAILAVLFTVYLSWHWLGAVMFILLGLVLWFYRDPERIFTDSLNNPNGKENQEENKNIFVSPADGKIVEIEPVTHLFTGDSIKIGIFMNVFSVHVNRVPCDGTVEYLEYVPGKKIAAFAPKASEINERNYVGLRTQHGPILLVQIAGLLARRIVCRIKRGDVLSIGERYGMIKLGSKVDVYLPVSTKLSVKINDKVYAGKSLLGVINHENNENNENNETFQGKAG